MREPAAVDLTNCDREPIHILGAIQPFGFLIALTSDWIVARVSANIADFLGRSPAELIGLGLNQLFPPAVVHDLRNRAAMIRGPDGVERMFGCKLIAEAPEFDVAIHFSTGQRGHRGGARGRGGTATSAARCAR